MTTLLTLLLLPFLADGDGQSKTPYNCTADDMASYVSAVRKSILDNWTHGRDDTKQCVVVVTQSFRGEVLNVDFGECEFAGSVRKSIEEAVYLASPLPWPANTHCHERTLTISLARTE